MLKSKLLKDLPCSRNEIHLSIIEIKILDDLFPVSADLIFLDFNFSKVSKSFSCNSKSIISLSLIGLTLPSTWVIFSSSKHLKTWIIALVSLILAKNLFPSPSPLLAPFTKPAISTISIFVGTTD